MKEEWKDLLITRVSLAVYVAPHTGKHVHEDRPFHGFVLNDDNGVKDYCFANGHVMRTEGGSLFYLPKHASYCVRTIRAGGCYAINFDAAIDDEPFALQLKQADVLKQNFRIACEEWSSHAQTSTCSALRTLYDAAYRALKAQERAYLPRDRRQSILPAIEAMDHDFTDPHLTVSALAARCGISEVYFRKIFIGLFDVSPKAYIIQKRMEYAKQLLSAREFGIAEVATLCGYGDPCHFSREFKRYFGAAPRKLQ